MRQWVTVRFQFVGFHHWPDAPPARAYLADRHRHLFHVEASVTTSHDDREIEFHELLDECSEVLRPGDYGGRSCEAIAATLLRWLESHYPHRSYRVAVFEDGEAGATLEALRSPSEQGGSIS